MKDYQLLLTSLFEKWAGTKPTSMIQLAPAGSDRRYFRISNESQTAIGTYNADFKENNAFVTLSQHFHQKGLNVPQVFAADLEQGIYLQEDLGDAQLFDLLPKRGETFQASLVDYYKKSLSALAQLQIRGGQSLDYSVCYPRAAFDKQSMLWDLNYFKHYFLKLAHIPFDEQLLEDDFHRFSNYLLQADCSHFLFRDFQSRNIMIKDGEPIFIDYQGGRQGALQYDVASLLYQAKGNIPAEIKQELLHHYMDEASKYTNIERVSFEQYYYGYVLIRCLQALGAYGFRGLYERRPHFISSIPYAIENIATLLEHLQLPVEMPELMRCLTYITEHNMFQGFDKKLGEASPLVVQVNSFSYKSGMPSDDSGNGGGFVFDCRFIFNPGRQDEYKHLTGRDEPVIDFLRKQAEMETFLQNVYNIVDKAVENYISRDFESLSVSFGCTGGQHRSVYSAENMARHLREKYGVKVALTHIQQEKKGWIN